MQDQTFIAFLYNLSIKKQKAEKKQKSITTK